jgi:hypothetical protein
MIRGLGLFGVRCFRDGAFSAPSAFLPHIADKTESLAQQRFYQALLIAINPR